MSYKENLVKWLNEEFDAELKEDDIKVSEYDDSTFETPFGEYSIFTDEQANEIHQERIENLVDDLGITGLFQEPYLSYIIENFLDLSELEDYAKEDYENYFSDIQSESASYGDFEDRCQEELAEDSFERYELEDYFETKERIEELRDEIDNLNSREEYEEEKRQWENELDKIMDDDINVDPDEIAGIQDKIDELEELIDELDDLENELEDAELNLDSNIEEWFENYEDNYDDLVESATEKILDEYDNLMEWFEFNFGKEAVTNLVNGKWGISVDVDYEGLSEYIIDTDGRGNELAGWDGVEHEFYNREDNEFFYIYKQDSTIYIKDEFEEDNDEVEMA